jgi:biotin operon repressor
MTTMTNEQALATLIEQNEVIITLLSRLVWTPEKLAEIVAAGKRNPDEYLSVYNALDGDRTGKQLAEIAGVTRQAISAVLQTWQDEGIILNVGTDSVPKYRRLMRVPEKRKVKQKEAKKEVAPESPETQQEMNASTSDQ